MRNTNGRFLLIMFLPLPLGSTAQTAPPSEAPLRASQGTIFFAVHCYE